MQNIIPKVLLSAPTSDRHGHLLKEWIEHLNSFTYNFFDVLLIDTTNDNGKYAKLLKKQKVHGKKVKVIRMPWDGKDHILRHLAYCRERIRKEFIKGDWNNLFFLDTDIFIANNALQRLLSHFKDNIGLCVPIYFKPYQKPCVLKSGDIIMSKGVDLFDYKEINAYRDFINRFLNKKLTEEEKNLVPFVIKDLKNPYLIKCYASGIGCLMVKREVLEKVEFRTHPTFLWGEDFWYFSEANDKNFEFWCDLDPKFEAVHKNVNWGLVLEKNKSNFNLTLAFGPTDAKEANFVHEVPEEEYVDTKTMMFDLGEEND